MDQGERETGASSKPVDERHHDKARQRRPDRAHVPASHSNHCESIGWYASFNELDSVAIAH